MDGVFGLVVGRIPSGLPFHMFGMDAGTACAMGHFGHLRSRVQLNQEALSQTRSANIANAFGSRSARRKVRERLQDSA